MNKERTVNLINNIFLILLVLLAGFTLGMKYSGGIETCRTYVKLYGCEMEGYSVAETNRLLNHDDSCKLICGDDLPKAKEAPIEEINITFIQNG